MNGSKKRLFVALGLPQEIISALTGLQQELIRFARDAKWVRPEGIHLTLKFLAYVEAEKIAAIENILQETAKHFDPVSVLVKGIGFFPNSRRPNVLWAGLECSDIHPLQSAVENALLPAGFEKENRAFSPHLTLARFREHTGLLPLVHETEKWKEARFGSFNADRVSLYESILHRQGAEYVILNSFRLNKK